MADGEEESLEEIRGGMEQGADRSCGRPMSGDSVRPTHPFHNLGLCTERLSEMCFG